ncbi:alpha/beta hydrolase [Piscinibacter sp. XHJ-5]|uniref:alpha/beta fold hydrolase n=1 Tax=Piscinibacter sp. XHJ-5 TaxID=3037797 RepID=UPI002452C034|nr:alpha/beta hydrolase [Piscinibacter sp. XHJ-5]
MNTMVTAAIDERPVLPAVPFHREAGSGPGVVCIHCNASSSSQWRPLMDRLAPRHRVLAPDTHGAGRGPAWPTDRPLTLHDEVALLEPVFERAGAPFALVGHSYGAAVALLAALKQPERVHALVLYEPTLFALVDAAAPAPNAADGIRDTVARAAAALAAGNRGAAAEAFIDYWMGAGAWAAKPESQRSAIEAAIVNVQGWGEALLGETTPLAAFRALGMPVLLMQGCETPPSARAVATLLARTLPRVETMTFEGLGHMGPITHPSLVDAATDEFLRRHLAP